jgi:phosphotransferase system enzyme I (PtsI)
MYPMITGPSELSKANEILQEVKDELRAKKIKFNKDIKSGVMIEVPSAAMTADMLAQQAHFFSIGTNDLIQYTLAVDRVNEQTANLYEPGHPGVLRLIKRAIDAAHDHGIEVGCCGEMASEPYLALILLGLNLDAFSMSPSNILQVKKMIRSVSLKDAAQLAQEVLGLENGKDVEMVSRQRLQSFVPEILSNDKND